MNSLKYIHCNLLQGGEAPFNRATLLNIGFLESSRDGDYTCFIFHDVDLIPEDDR